MTMDSTYGKRILLYFILFFATIVAVNALLMTIATRTFTGLSTEHPYEKGIAYNQVVKAEQAQEALEWQGQIEARPVAGAKHPTAHIVFTLKDKQGKVLLPDRQIAHMIRPTQAGMDFRAELHGGEADIVFPADGLWEIRIYAEVNKTMYQQSKRIVLP